MPKIPNARSQKWCEIYKKSREYKVTYVKQITLKVQMSPSPPKHRKLIAQARYFRLVEIDQPEVCLLPDVTSLSFLLVPPLPLSGTSCNVQYSGSPQRETWSKSTVNGEILAYKPRPKFETLK